jgi:hypothetical protein
MGCLMESTGIERDEHDCMVTVTRVSSLLFYSTLQMCLDAGLLLCGDVTMVDSRT